MTIGEALKKAELLIKKTEKQSPALDAEILLSHVLKKPKIHILLHPEYILSKGQAKKFLALVSRRAKGVPVPYLTGTKEFFGLSFFTSKSTIIPRPLTEELVYKLLAELKGKRNLKIIDVGTGTGNIITALANNLGSSNSYYGVDKSILVLKTAKKNASANKVKISFKRSDLLTSIKGPFDVIVANLPYLDPKQKLPKHEPKSALIAGNKGLAQIEKLFAQIKKYKLKPKIIALEAKRSHVQKIRKLTKRTGSACKLILVLEK